MDQMEINLNQMAEHYAIKTFFIFDFIILNTRTMNDHDVDNDFDDDQPNDVSLFPTRFWL